VSEGEEGERERESEGGREEGTDLDELAEAVDVGARVCDEVLYFSERLLELLCGRLCVAEACEPLLDEVDLVLCARAEGLLELGAFLEDALSEQGDAREGRRCRQVLRCMRSGGE